MAELPRERAILESLPAIVYVAEPEPPYSPIYVSSFIESLGYSREEWFRRDDLWVKLIVPEDRDWVLRETARARAEGLENDYEYRVATRSGEVRWLLDRGRFVPNEDGAPLYWQGIIFDVTGRRVTHPGTPAPSGAPYGVMMGESAPMRQVYERIADLASVDATVLIEGETGTGKELVARAIHRASPRRHKPLVAVNCAGLTESLLTSQLFGHRRGAFTGAIADQVGLIEAAHGGTLFLDEVGDMPLSVQTSLLRVLQEREITRLGETKSRKVDVRFVAATHRNLKEEVAAGRFRADLLYRIRVATIRVPALRERRDDIPLLAESFLGEFTGGLTGRDITAGAMRLLCEYPWPGNVRELRAAIESAAVCAKHPRIDVPDLPAEMRSHLCGQEALDWRSLPRQTVLGALEEARGNRSRAARLLGVSRATFYRHLGRLRS